MSACYALSLLCVVGWNETDRIGSQLNAAALLPSEFSVLRWLSVLNVGLQLVGRLRATVCPGVSTLSNVFSRCAGRTLDVQNLSAALS